MATLTRGHCRTHDPRNASGSPERFPSAERLQPGDAPRPSLEATVEPGIRSGREEARTATPAERPALRLGLAPLFPDGRQ